MHAKAASKDASPYTAVARGNDALMRTCKHKIIHMKNVTSIFIIYSAF